jgi:hypothetical protein
MITLTTLSRVCALVALGLVLTVPARADDHDLSRKTHVALGGFVLASFYDVIATTDCVAKRTCVEANPLYRGVAKRNTRAAMMLKAGTTMGITAWVLHDRKDHPQRAFWSALGLFGAQAFVCVHNYRTFTGRR